MVGTVGDSWPVEIDDVVPGLLLKMESPAVALDITDEKDRDDGRFMGEGVGKYVDIRGFIESVSGSKTRVVTFWGGSGCIGASGGMGKYTTGPVVTWRKYVVK